MRRATPSRRTPRSATPRPARAPGSWGRPRRSSPRGTRRRGTGPSLSGTPLPPPLLREWRFGELDEDRHLARRLRIGYLEPQHTGQPGEDDEAADDLYRAQLLVEEDPRAGSGDDGGAQHHDRRDPDVHVLLRPRHQQVAGAAGEQCEQRDPQPLDARDRADGITPADVDGGDDDRAHEEHARDVRGRGYIVETRLLHREQVAGHREQAADREEVAGHAGVTTTRRAGDDRDDASERQDHEQHLAPTESLAEQRHRDD